MGIAKQAARLADMAQAYVSVDVCAIQHDTHLIAVCAAEEILVAATYELHTIGKLEAFSISKIFRTPINEQPVGLDVKGRAGLAQSHGDSLIDRSIGPIWRS